MGKGREGIEEEEAARIGRNSFNWKLEETRCRGKNGESWRGMNVGGPIVVLYPRARSTSLTPVLHTFSRVRRYTHVRTGSAEEFHGT